MFYLGFFATIFFARNALVNWNMQMEKEEREWGNCRVGREREGGGTRLPRNSCPWETGSGEDAKINYTFFLLRESPFTINQLWEYLQSNQDRKSQITFLLQNKRNGEGLGRDTKRKPRRTGGGGGARGHLSFECDGSDVTAYVLIRSFQVDVTCV